MEKQANFFSPLPLKELALRRVVGLLWTQVDISAPFQVHDYLSYLLQLRYAWVSEGEDMVKNKLSELTLPASLLKKATPLIRPVGLEIHNWIKFHLKYFEASLRKVGMGNILSTLSWTAVGTVNYRRTVETLIRLERIDSHSIYKLACLYCLEDLLNQKFPLKGIMNLGDDRELRKPPLHAFWLNILKEEKSDVFDLVSSEPCRFNQHAFEKAAHSGNRAATKYFYQKLTDEEKQLLLFKTAKDVATRNRDELSICSEFPRKTFTDVLVYLLSQMSPEQQMALLKMHLYRVLEHLLEWPWQQLFLDIVELTWDFLSLDNYYALLKRSDVDLFQGWFRRSPCNFKKFFIDKECLDGSILINFLFCREDSDLITFIFRNIDAADKVRLAFCFQGYRLCGQLIRLGKWHLLKVFIREAMLSKEERERLKGTLEPYISEIYEGSEYSRKILEWERFFQSFDESNGKRSLEDDAVVKTNKLCSAE